MPPNRWRPYPLREECKGCGCHNALYVVVPAFALPDQLKVVRFPGLERFCVISSYWKSASNSDKAVYSTVDNGRTWRVAASRSTPPAGPAGIREIQTLEPTFLAYVTQGWVTVRVKLTDGQQRDFVYSTIEGGKTWSVKPK